MGKKYEVKDYTSTDVQAAMKDEDIEFIADNVCDVLGLRSKAS